MKVEAVKHFAPTRRYSFAAPVSEKSETVNRRNDLYLNLPVWRAQRLNNQAASQVPVTRVHDAAESVTAVQRVSETPQMSALKTQDEYPGRRLPDVTAALPVRRTQRTAV